MNFYQRVYQITHAIPHGKVATYGQIAALLGSPRAARMVGQALARCTDPAIPWQRVINRHGMVSIENLHVTKDDQVYLLRQDGITVEQHDGNYWVDLEKYLVDSNELIRTMENESTTKQIHTMEP